MEDLVKELKELEELVIKCMKCGTCQAHCPLYKKDFFEQSVARGKISMIESVYEGNLKDASRILKYIDYCLMCGRCKNNCPSGVKTDEIFLRAKSALRKVEKLPSWGKFVLKIVMEKPELLSRISPLMHIGLKFGSKQVKDDVFKPLFGLYSRNVASFAKKSFCDDYAGFHQAENEKLRVIFYPGCAVNYIYKHWGETIVKLLKKLNVSVYVPDVNKCCGIPAATLGDMELYAKMVDENRRLFKSLDAGYVITCCPTCSYGLFDMGETVAHETFDKKEMDILVFLKEMMGLSPKQLTLEKTSLHIPCHYNHSEDALLKNLITDISENYYELKDQSCCGFGGTFNLKNYDSSKNIVKNKTVEVREEKVKKLFTPCPGCAMQLTDGIIREGGEADVLHPVELIYRGLIDSDVSEDKTEEN